MTKNKFFLMTTVSMSLNFFSKQINALNDIYDVTLISSPSKQLVEIANREEVKSCGIEIKREISIISDIRSLIKLFFLFLKERPKIIHCNTPKASLLGLVAGFITRVPHRIYYVHGLRYEGTFGKKRKVLICLEKVSCFCATKIIAVSFGVKNKIQFELSNKDVAVIHNGSANGMFVEDFLDYTIDIKKEKKTLGITENDFVFGFVGRIVSDKGINELISSFKKIQQNYDNVKLILVGFYEENLDPLSKETIFEIKNNKNIIETGFQADIKKYLSLMDVFVSPSFREGFGLSLLEANLMGIPVIASNITGYSEIIQENKNGFLVQSKNENALYSKMEEVYNDSNSLKLMKNYCIMSAIQRYNHQDVLKEAMDYYKTLN